MTRDAQEEHDTDAPDHADAYFLIDDGEARLGVSDCCGKYVCACEIVWERPVRHRRPVRPYPSRIVTDR